MSDAPMSTSAPTEDRDATVLEQTRENYRQLVAAAQADHERALQKARAASRNLHWEDVIKKELDDQLRAAEKQLNLAKDCLRGASPLWVQQRRLALLQVAATLVAAHPMFTGRAESDDFMQREVLRLANSLEDYVASGWQPY